MVTISTTLDDKEKAANCVTPKKKAANSTEATTEQTAPNILVYKKVTRLIPMNFIITQIFLDGVDCRADAGGERWSIGADCESFHVENSISVQWSRSY